MGGRMWAGGWEDGLMGDGLMGDGLMGECGLECGQVDSLVWEQLLWTQNDICA